MNKNELTCRKIFFFWLPLAATWFMISFEGPYLAAIIARLSEPKYNLAAYGVAFSFALIIEAPIIMIMSASTALVKDRDSFLKLKYFTYGLNGVITLIMLLLLVPSVFYFLAEKLNLPGNVAHLTHIASDLLLPWPAAIGYRRLYQGILIRNNLTRRVAYGTLIRLSSMTLTALIFYCFFHLPGAYVGACALSAGVFMEALASRFMARSIVKKLLEDKSEPKNPMTYGFIAKFYYPMALSSILILGVQPMVTFFMGQSPFPIESLAVLPVVISLTFIFRCFGVSFQEVGVALLGENNKEYIPLRNFAINLGIPLVLGMSVIAFTPVSIIWFHNISGLSMELTRFAIFPLRVMVLIPGLALLSSFQRAVIIKSQNTASISWATAIEAGGILLVLLILIKYTDMPGASAASIAFFTGSLCSGIYLFFPFFMILKNTYPVRPVRATTESCPSLSGKV